MSPTNAALTSLNGMPAFVGTDEGTIAAGLVVRVGECDESLPHHGISHLVEHLLLSGIDRRLTAWNGFVDLQTTNFVVQGSPSDVVEFFNTVGAAILNPPYDRIPTESQVLRTEAAGRAGRGVLATSAATRIGPRDYGLREYREFCFDQPSPQLVHHWLSTYFTSGNAAFWCTGPLPAGLELALPPGQRVPLPRPTWIDEVLPGVQLDRRDSVACTIVGEWTIPLMLSIGAAREHLFDLLRGRLGLSYDVSTGIESFIGGRLLHGAIWADGLTENLEAIRDQMSAEMNRLCWDGASTEVLERTLESMRRALAADQSSPAAAQARCHLFDVPFVDLADMIAVLEMLTPVDVARTLETAMRTALWIVPQSVGWHDHRVTHTRGWSRTRVPGPPVSIAAPDGDADHRKLIVGADGLTMLVGPDENLITVRFDDVAALLAYPNGDRTMVGNDGFSIRLEADRWPDAHQLAAYLDGRVPPSQIVRIPAR